MTGLYVFGGLIVLGVAALIFFKQKAAKADKKQARGRAETIEVERIAARGRADKIEADKNKGQDETK
ncbi:hypothetical protein ACFLWS_03145 [Chloroflexota bacterium]